MRRLIGSRFSFAVILSLSAVLTIQCSSDFNIQDPTKRAGQTSGLSTINIGLPTDSLDRIKSQMPDPAEFDRRLHGYQIVFQPQADSSSPDCQQKTLLGLLEKDTSGKLNSSIASASLPNGCKYDVYGAFGTLAASWDAAVQPILNNSNYGCLQGCHVQANVPINNLYGGNDPNAFTPGSKERAAKFFPLVASGQMPKKGPSSKLQNLNRNDLVLMRAWEIQGYPKIATGSSDPHTAKFSGLSYSFYGNLQASVADTNNTRSGDTITVSLEFSLLPDGQGVFPPTKLAPKPTPAPGQTNANVQIYLPFEPRELPQRELTLKLEHNPAPGQEDPLIGTGIAQTSAEELSLNVQVVGNTEGCAKAIHFRGHTSGFVALQPNAVSNMKIRIPQQLQNGGQTVQGKWILQCAADQRGTIATFQKQ